MNNRQDEGDYSFPGDEGTSQGQDVVHSLFEEEADQASDVSEMTPVAPAKPHRRFHLGHLAGGLFLAVFGGSLFYWKVIAPRANAQAASDPPSLVASDPRHVSTELAPPPPPPALPRAALGQPSFEQPQVQAGGLGNIETTATEAGPAPAAESMQRDLSMASKPVNNEAVQELQGRLGEMEAQNSRLEQRIAEIEEQLRQRRAAAATRAAVRPKRVAPQKQPSAERTLSDYTVRVARTGQAWLDHAGQTLVVQVGDSLPNGARVSGIDPASGRVRTSLGVVLP